MTPGELRNYLVDSLYRHTGRKVVLSDQTLPEAEMPYILYQPTQPYMSRGGVNLSNHPSPEGVLAIREEQAEGTFSFNACSCNRATSDGYVFGLDEAEALAGKIHAWFTHGSKVLFARAGIVVVEITNVQVRSQLEVDEMDRRVGFDVRIRYPYTLAREDQAIDPGSIFTPGSIT